MPRLRLAFMGTPDFAVPALAALLEAGHDIASVYSQPPRPSGRGQKLQPSPVHLFAESRSLAVRTPAALKSPEVQADFVALGADAAVVVAYGLILPKAILATPRLGCLNIHASLLPRWRGAAPIQRAILAGDAETGVTIMQMDEGLDTGAMLLQERVPIAPAETGATLHDRLAELGARMIVSALDGLAAGKLRPAPQPADGVTYAAKLTREEARLDWRQPAAALERQVRAFDPWPGAWLDYAGERIRVLDARVDGPAKGRPGSLRPGTLTVACGDGTGLELLQVQRAGRKAMSAAEFLRGFSLPAGAVLP
ncbi:MAG: methionyl-tRNA formyltransferase [Alphaproteobacteria bacterium]|nr:MAG: methionyl-tRNA formyltransferase [Alphaproteobacteria bacterium]